MQRQQPILVSIVVSIPACHAGDRGSIPRLGGFLFHLHLIIFFDDFNSMGNYLLFTITVCNNHCSIITKITPSFREDLVLEIGSRKNAFKLIALSLCSNYQDFCVIKLV